MLFVSGKILKKSYHFYDLFALLFHAKFMRINKVKSFGIKNKHEIETKVIFASFLGLF